MMMLSSNYFNPITQIVKFNTMKKLALIAVMAIAIVSTLFAQDGERGKRGNDRIESLRVAFLTEKLELTSEESQNFWPIYREMTSEIKSIREQGKKPKGEIESLTDKEAEAMILQHFEIQEKVLDLKKEYFKKLRTAIPPRKIAMLEPLEKRFKQRLLNRVRKGKRGREMQREY